MNNEIEKKEYQEPKLIEWGSVYDLTRGGTGEDIDTPGGGSRE